jgi:hypothetical protein
VGARDLDNRDEDDLTTPVVVELTVTRVDGHRVDRVLLAVVPIETETRDKAETADTADTASSESEGDSHV